MPSKSARDPWLDFLRAAAIIAVLVHHIGQEWPVARPWIYPYTSMGAKGVDLFFVLSGWLIGGLFWRERQRLGRVDLPRFWARRWLRTIPPYAGGLALAWIAVWFYRSEPFDAGYLLFVQNYYAAMPFFFVSWSLCIEEHFYLFVPLLFYYFRHHTGWMLVILALLPAFFRFLEYPIDSGGFGYAVTATHLRADGLLLGFAAAYVSVYRSAWLDRLRPVLVVAAVAAAGLLALDMGSRTEFVTGSLLLAVAFLGLLVALVQQPAGKWFGNSAIAWVARTSYSVYLTHVLVIHSFVLGIYPQLKIGEPPALVFEIGLIFLSGWVFHLVFERTSFAIRERLAPAQGR